ncbi:MAG: divalent metal cation transporter [Anaerolineaceae bacterium]|jgi:Mn2+/Fe2+ NRAMP family transporter|nr:divalent metal cation transporter [Anaerolineaceae bacterium]
MPSNSLFKRKWANLPFIHGLLIFFSVFGPATITAMADNDAGGVATYSVAGATLGYPVLFLLPILTLLLAVTQEMGMRLTLVTRRGLADLIRERFGVRISILIFSALLIANLGTLTVEFSAFKTTSAMLHLAAFPFILIVVVMLLLVLTKGNYKLTQGIMLVSSLFYVAYIISAVKVHPDWGMALSNIVYPHGVEFTPAYLRSYLLIGMGVLGTTITPWGQFFISSFAYDKKIEAGKIIYSQMETYVGAFLTDFFSFFMIVATAATLFVNKIPLESGDAAAKAIEPFAGALASTLFAVGILIAGFMGLIAVSLSTAYAFAEFFGVQGSLDSNYKQSKSFYTLIFVQLIVALIIAMLPGISLFSIAIISQTINAIALPLVFYYLIKLTDDRQLMGQYHNNGFQKWFAIGGSVVIFIASVATLIATFLKL